MKIFLKFLKWTGITLGLIVVLFVSINAFDEVLDPGAAAILNAQSTVKPEDNAYFFLVGLGAPLDRDPGKFGLECVTRLANVAKSHKETMVLITRGNTGCTNHEIGLTWQEISDIHCRSQQEGCLSRNQKQSATIMLLANKNKIRLQRFEHLLAMEQFEDTPYANHLTAPLPLDLTNDLYSAISTIKLQEENAGEFIQRTAAEAKFYRMVLRGNSGFLSKLVALAKVNRAARLVSEAIHIYPMLAREHCAALLTISQPLTVAERSLESAIVAELRQIALTLAFAASVEEASFLDRLLTRFVLKYNATINRFYQNFPGWRDLSKLPTEQYLTLEKRMLAQLTNPWRDGYVRMLYNPMGKLLVGINNANYGDYPRRIIDADGRLRLISLQIQIAAQKIPESEISNFLQNADPQFRDPYTGLPMQWDKTRGLHFRGYGKSTPDQDGFISVKL